MDATDMASESQSEKDSPEVHPVSIEMDDIMESMTRITFCGLGGTIVGLSLEKRIEAMKLTTAESVAAAARRKRGQISSPNQSTYPLSMMWAVSCMVFCSVIELSRLASPSTWILREAEKLTGKPSPISEYDESMRNANEVTVSVTDHAIGGAIAGVVCSFGRRMYAKNSTVRQHGPRRLAGFFPGLALGVAAGTIQSAIDYGAKLAKDYGASAAE